MVVQKKHHHVGYPYGMGIYILLEFMVSIFLNQIFTRFSYLVIFVFHQIAIFFQNYVRLL